MAKRVPIGAFNKDYLAKVTESGFLESHKHLGALGFTSDVLKKIWKDAQTKAESKKD